MSIINNVKVKLEIETRSSDRKARISATAMRYAAAVFRQPNMV